MKIEATENGQLAGAAAVDVPEAGQVRWLDVGPSVGHEQDGYRPVVVVSDERHNRATGSFVGVIVTSQIRGWPLEVPLSGLPKPSVARCDQVNTFDWRARAPKYRGESVSLDELTAIRERVCGICGSEEI